MAKYSKSLISKITELISKDSYSVNEICRISGISESTFHQWKKDKPEFSEAIQRAKEQFTERLVVSATRSLLKLVEGFTYTESRNVYSKSSLVDSEGKQILRFKERVVYEKYHRPSVPAIIFVLTNKDPKNWKNTFRVEVVGRNNPENARILSMKDVLSIGISFSKKSDKELDQILQAGEKKLSKNIADTALNNDNINDNEPGI